MASDFPPIPLVLERKDLSGVHIVVGSECVHQVEFLQAVVGAIEVIVIEGVLTDQTIYARQETNTVVLYVEREQNLQLAEDTRRRVSVWSCGPVAANSAACHSLVRYAARILGREVAPELLHSVSAAVVSENGPTSPLGGLVWSALGLITKPPATAHWKQPWESPTAWVPPTVAPSYRLNTLHKDLTHYVYSLDGQRKHQEFPGLSPARFRWLEGLRLDSKKVDATLVILSAWRMAQDDGYIAALKISAIWACS